MIVACIYDLCGPHIIDYFLTLNLRPETHAAQGLAFRPKEDVGKTAIEAIISYEDPYVQPLILSALSSVFPTDLIKVTDKIPETESFSLEGVLSSPAVKTLAITAYESIDFEFAAAHTQTCLINSYMIRKALIRKHYLSTTIDHWVAKNPESVLKKHFKRSEAFEVDYAEFLDDALVEAFDLRESLDSNDTLAEDQRQWWILKPGMSDRGQGIRLFSTMDELQAIFDGWEEDRPESDDEDEDEEEEGGGITRRDSTDESVDYLNTSHLRHFVAQPYIHPPLLLSNDNKKFHIRTYVLCTGSLTVHVYRHMLALFAGKSYTAPWEAPDDIESFLTNTCLQSSPNENTVRRFWDLPLPKEILENVFEQIVSVTGEVFEAAARAMPIHFQTMGNAFEVFGLDFMVDAEECASLLEINAFPDFKQTGGDLQDIVKGFWDGVMRTAVAPFLDVEGTVLEGGEEGMVLARKVDLGRG